LVVGAWSGHELPHDGPWTILFQARAASLKAATATMKTSDLQTILASHRDCQLVMILPDGGRVPAHAHVTEVGRIDRHFIDCGGTVHRSSFCCLQAWVADDVDHRLTAGKLADIIGRAEALEVSDLDVEIEYEDGFISQFPVLEARVEGDTLVLSLGTKHTDCLAKDVCLPAEPSGECCVGSGCCG
jgi:hypothetical protein